MINNNFFYIGFLFLLGAGMLTGCTPIPHKLKVPTEHVVMFDEDGRPLNPTGNFWFAKLPKPKEDSVEKYHTDLSWYENEDFDTFEGHTDKIIAKMKAFKTKKVLIFIHGGLNTQMDSVERLVQDPRTGEICNEDDSSLKKDQSPCQNRVEMIKEAGYFPLFINWRSSLINSYTESLFTLRQGESKPAWGAITFPFVLAYDVGKSLLRWPVVTGSLIFNDSKTIPFSSYAQKYPATVAKEVLCRRYKYPYLNSKGIKWTEENCIDENNGLKFSEAPWVCPFNLEGVKGNNTPNKDINKNADTFDFYVDEDKRKCLELTSNFGAYILTFPSKVLVTPVVDAFGSSSWDVMLRHTDMLFHSEDELTESNMTNKAAKMGQLVDLPMHGGLAMFLQKLAKMIEADKANQWEITLVGHSMGTIVANQLVRDFGEKLPITKVVYLAAAATVFDYEVSIFPWLAKTKDHHMYHFQLHPRAEEGEKMAFDIPARGSLLVWIDNFLSKPLSPMARTVGRYDNLLPVLHNADLYKKSTQNRSDDFSIRKQISIKIYGAGNQVEYANPQTHSDVAARFKFWEEKCFEPNTNSKDCVFPKP
jgi:hypothetical protein